ncbi:hypothetical protein [Henriciella marina]|uniref:hypothetical protein n=1 Tax=Henriciella marina TaxID=453851 RepID=UPI00036B28E1|nr:hypothetical protein [Henriciella marina]
MSARIRLVVATAASITILLGAAAWFHFTEDTGTGSTQTVLVADEDVTTADPAGLDETGIELARNDVPAVDGTDSEVSPMPLFPEDTVITTEALGASAEDVPAEETLDSPLTETPQD